MRLISKIYKQLIQMNIQNQNNLIEKLVEGLPWWSSAKTLQS